MLVDRWLGGANGTSPPGVRALDWLAQRHWKSRSTPGVACAVLGDDRLAIWRSARRCEGRNRSSAVEPQRVDLAEHAAPGGIVKGWSNTESLVGGADVPPGRDPVADAADRPSSIRTGRGRSVRTGPVRLAPPRLQPPASPGNEPAPHVTHPGVRPQKVSTACATTGTRPQTRRNPPRVGGRRTQRAPESHTAPTRPFKKSDRLTR